MTLLKDSACRGGPGGRAPRSRPPRGRRSQLARFCRGAQLPAAEPHFPAAPALCPRGNDCVTFNGTACLRVCSPPWCRSGSRGGARAGLKGASSPGAPLAAAGTPREAPERPRSPAPAWCPVSGVRCPLPRPLVTGFITYRRRGRVLPLNELPAKFPSHSWVCDIIALHVDTIFYHNRFSLFLIKG